MTRPMAHASEYDLTALSWNVKVGRPFKQVHDQLAAWLTIHQPDVVTLNEVYRHAPDIARAFRKDWVVIYDTESKNPEARDVVLMVRKTDYMQVAGIGFLRHGLPWVGPEGRSREGRVFPYARIVKHGRVYLVLAVHRVPMPRRNAKSYAQETDLLRSFATRKRQHGVIYAELGDRNQTRLFPTEQSGRAYAKSIAARYFTGSGVDAAVVRGAKATCTKLGKGGSDHEAILWRLTKN